MKNLDIAAKDYVYQMYHTETKNYSSRAKLYLKPTLDLLLFKAIKVSLLVILDNCKIFDRVFSRLLA